MFATGRDASPRRRFLVQGSVDEVMGRLARWHQGSEIAIGIIAIADLPAIGQGLGSHPACQVVREVDTAAQGIGDALDIPLRRAASRVVEGHGAGISVLPHDGFDQASPARSHRERCCADGGRQWGWVPPGRRWCGLRRWSDCWCSRWRFWYGRASSPRHPH